MVVAKSAGDLVAYYERRLAGVDDAKTSDTEAMLALVARDDLEDRWSELTAEHRERVSALDDLLVSKHAVVAEVLPNRLSTDRRRWWWHLHEGPQVREEALAASQRQ